MKLFIFTLIALAAFANAKPHALRESTDDEVTRALRLVHEDEDDKVMGKQDIKSELEPLHIPEDDITMEREFTTDGDIPEGRRVPEDPDHPLAVPVDMPERSEEAGDGHRQMYYVWYPACTYCMWDPFWGWISYCCADTCGWYYC